MFKEYIRNIVKEEINDIKLENTLKQLGSKTYWEDRFKTQLKHTEASVKGRDKEIFRLKEIIENLEGKLISKGNLLSEQKEENKHLKITLKLSKNKILELKDLYEQEKNKNYKTLESVELKQENEKLNGDKEVLKVALEESKNYVAYLEKETKKLNEKLDGIKCVIKKQRLSALTYEKLKKTFILIERYLKES